MCTSVTMFVMDYMRAGDLWRVKVTLRYRFKTLDRILSAILIGAQVTIRRYGHRRAFGYINSQLAIMSLVLLYIFYSGNAHK